MPSLLLRCSIVAAALLLASCKPAEEGRADVTVIGEAPTLVDPALAPLTEPQAVLLANIAQGLVRFDASGQIVPGLAERWNVTDDGLSYIFRLQTGEWPDGRKITAEQVARILKRQLARRSENPLKDTLGAIDEIVAMTDRVIEISLRAPRPNLLAILAQPEFAIVYQNQGSGPFEVVREGKEPAIDLHRTVSNLDEQVSRREEVLIHAAPAPAAVRAFIEDKTSLVLGGTYADLPYARAQELPRNALRFDPAAGLFGLAPAREDGPLADEGLRNLLTRSVDRQALIDRLDVPGLLPRATVLEPGLEGVPDMPAPDWMAVPIAERRQQLVAEADRLFGDIERPTIYVAVPDAPGAGLLLSRLAADWGVFGITVERASDNHPADLRLIDAVAPSNSPAWFLRQFRCDNAELCDAQADELLDSARNTPVPAQRNALLTQAAQLIDQKNLFIPLAAPIRWSLVSARVTGFSTNRFARHTLTDLGQRPDRNRE